MEEKAFFSYFPPHSVDTKIIENVYKYKEKVDVFPSQSCFDSHFKTFYNLVLKFYMINKYAPQNGTNALEFT